MEVCRTGSPLVNEDFQIFIYIKIQHFAVDNIYEGYSKIMWTFSTVNVAH